MSDECQYCLGYSDTIETLQTDNKQRVGQVYWKNVEIEKLESQIKTLKAIVKCGDEVCEFYGARDMYHKDEMFDNWSVVVMLDCDKDEKTNREYAGQLAREKTIERDKLKEGLLTPPPILIYKKLINNFHDFFCYRKCCRFRKRKCKGSGNFIRFK